MTIPPELAALQQRILQCADDLNTVDEATVRDELMNIAKDISTWPQRASGEAVAWIDPEYIPELAANYVVNVNLSGGLAHTKFGELDGLVPLYTHPAATSAQVAIYFCSGPSGSIWALDESEIEPTIKQFAEAHGDDPGEYTATPFYSKPADTSALEQILHDPENQPSQYGTYPMEYVEKLRGMLKWLCDEGSCTCTFPSKDCCAHASVRTLLAGEGNG